MKEEKITTETAKAMLLPVLEFKRKKGQEPFFEINTAVSIPTMRTIDAICNKRLMPEEDEVILLVPSVKIGCNVTPRALIPGMKYDELRITFLNVENRTVRLNPGEPILFAVVVSNPNANKKKDETKDK